MEIRIGKESDVASITDIFNFYIKHSNARFSEEPLTYQDRLQWFSQFSANPKHQLYVATEQNTVIGFACSQPYRAGKAFEDTVEATIYLSQAAKGKGLGSQLYAQLFAALATTAVHRAVCGIALPNDASIALHKKFGFREVGVFTECAKKHGNYISSMWLEKAFNVDSAL